ncbi:uncharacterized protein LOC119654010 [Hermetia illucens]|uniref:uncharacterized protein LOC119654010 n=1 Tax=Hermetia illucens TaxID=343691 RepID=UPI0018CC7B46|nr:uncharacterized protein LOC119654010 [Hermetia illucens]
MADNVIRQHETHGGNVKPKTKADITSSHTDQHKAIRIREFIFGTVNNFCYKNCSARDVTIRSKLIVYKAMFLPVITNFSETLVLSKKNCELLPAFKEESFEEFLAPYRRKDDFVANI